MPSANGAPIACSAEPSASATETCQSNPSLQAIRVPSGETVTNVGSVERVAAAPLASSTVPASASNASETARRIPAGRISRPYAAACVRIANVVQGIRTDGPGMPLSHEVMVEPDTGLSR